MVMVTLRHQHKVDERDTIKGDLVDICLGNDVVSSWSYM